MVSDAANHPKLDFRGLTTLPTLTSFPPPLVGLSKLAILSLTSSLNLILFGLRYLILSDSENVSYDQYDQLIKTVPLLQQFGALSANVLLKDFKKFCDQQILESTREELNSICFRTAINMWLEKSLAEKHVRPNFVEASNISVGTSNEEFHAELRNAINTSYTQTIHPNADESMLTVQFGYAVQNNKNTLKHSFPLVIRLDVPNQPNQYLYAEYRLVGVFYITGDRKDIILYIAAKDELGRDVRFEYIPGTKADKLSKAQDALMRLPSSENESNVSIKKPFPTTFTKTYVDKSKKRFMANGLLFVLSTTQNSAFKGQSITTSELLCTEPVNHANDILIFPFDIQQIDDKVCLNDKCMDFFSHFIANYLNCDRNMVAKACMMTCLENEMQSTEFQCEEDIFKKCTKHTDRFYGNNRSMYDEGNVLHLPTNYPKGSHWIYIYVSFSEKRVCFCNSTFKIKRSSKGSPNLSEAASDLGPKVLKFLEYEHQYRIDIGQLPLDHVFDRQEWGLVDRPCQFQQKEDHTNCGVLVILNLYRMMKNIKAGDPLELNCSMDLGIGPCDSVREKMVEICMKRSRLTDLDEFNP